MKKADNTVGHRAFEESQELAALGDESLNRFCASLGMSNSSAVYAWEKGKSPSAYYLAKLYEAGADIGYILTGRRTKK